MSKTFLSNHSLPYLSYQLSGINACSCWMWLLSCIFESVSMDALKAGYKFVSKEGPYGPLRISHQWLKHEGTHQVKRFRRDSITVLAVNARSHRDDQIRALQTCLLPFFIGRGYDFCTLYTGEFWKQPQVTLLKRIVKRAQLILLFYPVRRQPISRQCLPGWLHTSRYHPPFLSYTTNHFS